MNCGRLPSQPGRCARCGLDVQQQEFPGAAVVAVGEVAVLEIEPGERQVTSFRRPGHGGRQVRQGAAGSGQQVSAKAGDMSTAQVVAVFGAAAE
ncbi:hypothetical protein QNM99_26065 [Pseudomonas sp. PCH446]